MNLVVFDDRGSRPAPTLDRSQVRIDFFRASGNGGQNRNKVSSAVRLLHRPTGMIVTATEQRDQPQNLAVAWQRLETALARQAQHDSHQATNQTRRTQLGNGRSFTWTAWRDDVRSSDGRRTSMRQALKGRLGPLI